MKNQTEISGKQTKRMKISVSNGNRSSGFDGVLALGMPDDSDTVTVLTVKNGTIRCRAWFGVAAVVMG